MKVVAELRHGDLFHSSNIVSSIEFDRDDELFATAGVSRRIKIFSFATVRLLQNTPNTAPGVLTSACRTPQLSLQGVAKLLSFATVLSFTAPKCSRACFPTPPCYLCLHEVRTGMPLRVMDLKVLKQQQQHHLQQQHLQQHHLQQQHLHQHHLQQLFSFSGSLPALVLPCLRATQVVSDLADVHCPVVEMPTRSKLSCLSWNQQHKAQVASSDYRGHRDRAGT